jgi:hypothetical protein
MLLPAIAGGIVAGIVEGATESAFLYRVSNNNGVESVDYLRPPQIIDHAKVTIGVFATLGLLMEQMRILPIHPDALAGALSAVVASALTRRVIITLRQGNLVKYG